ncbi:hypothetical protein E4T50_03710 [Aureobasidium sp. EXF-12298]|nr:hypothetical protein E4T50_03710 [Aureobasidium sp. EXF-12298]KAI4751821.1 hypothetical protein E4T51_14984 [Aureobasidium sp. EXF-12344]KAI4781060.1 hypothetical protein E4T52_03968 [Aureobasidium sp. EXF-3400]
MQLRVYTSLAIFAATAMAASATTSAAAASTSAVDLTLGVPQCGIACIQSAVGASGCSPTDAVCLCTTGAKAFQAAGTTCLLQNSDCSATDLQTITTIAKQRCATVLSAAGIDPSAAALGASSASVSGSATKAAKSATATGGAMQFGASIMAVGAGALAFIL